MPRISKALEKTIRAGSKEILTSMDSENGTIIELFDKGVLIFSLTKQYTNMLNVIEIGNILKYGLFIKEKYKEEHI